MPKISDILSQHSIDRETLAKAYKSVIGKALPARAATIKDEELAKILPTFAPAGIGKPKKEEPKVFKAEELAFGDDFLSGLGFSTKEEPVAEEPEEEDMFNAPLTPKAPAEEPEKPVFGNARVIGSDPTPVRSERPRTPFKKKDAATPPPARPTQTSSDKPASETKGKTFHTFGAAPAFAKGQYKGGQHVRPASGPTRSAAPAPKAPAAPVAPRVQREAATSGTLVKKQEIIIGDSISVKEFSEKMGVTFPELMKKFMANKIMVNINSNIDFDTANIIGEEFGVKVKKETGNISIEDMMSGNLQAILAIDKEAEHTEKRPPVVTIMGHVDHGKTKLLDYLRKTNVVSAEAGGITQSIGASQIVYNGEKITFIDTPGHELFTSLRARGAKVTNIVIIVIAVDDGIKQQTVEAIKHAQEAGVPIIVAVTKIDKGHLNNLDNIKTQMAEHGLTAEDWGGDVPVIPLSAVSGEGVDDLLERILLQSEMLELAYNPKRNAVGVVLEVTKDPKQGVQTTILLMTGTMKVGDIIMVHNTYGKVRRMVDRSGKEIKVAHGGDPVMILGMQDIPEPGRVAEVTDTERQAQERIAAVIEQEKSQKESGGAQSLLSQMQSGETLNLNVIVKADSYGSLEAVKYSLAGLPTPENMTVKIISSDVGTFGEADIALAHAAGAIIIGFNVPIPASIVKKGQTMGVTIKTYDIIYEMNDYIDGILKGMIVIEAKEVIIGKLNILAIFFKKEKEMIIGGKVIEGETRNGAQFRVWRMGKEGEEEVIAQGRITSLQRGQDNVNTVAVGHECGMKVRTSKKILESDTLEFFVME